MTAMLLLSCGPITAVGDDGHGGITWGKPQKHAHHTQKEKTMARTQWTSRVVTDTIGDAGTIILNDESGDEALAGAWWKCGDEGEGWITDEADIEAAAEYLKAVAGN